MAKSRWIILGAFIALLPFIALYLQKPSDSPNPEETITLPKPGAATPENERGPHGKLIGEKLLHKYGSADTTLRDDLTGMQRLSLSYVTLVKNHARKPIGCNADLAEALRGNNPYKQRFLPDKHQAFNEKGELIDRWETPLFIHPISAGNWEIRSAGPDKKLWTDDDLNLGTQGKFSEGFDKKPLYPSRRKKK